MATVPLGPTDEEDEAADTSGAEFWSLGNLLDQGHTPAELATLIEKGGIQFWDEYGRPKSASLSSKDAREVAQVEAALAALAEEHAAHLDPGVAPPSISEDGTGLYARFGWSDENWKRITRGMEFLPTAAAARRGEAQREKTDLAIIAVLLKFIEGSRTGTRHPDFRNRTELAALLGDDVEHRGTSKRTLEQRFALALKTTGNQ